MKHWKLFAIVEVILIGVLLVGCQSVKTQDVEAAALEKDDASLRVFQSKVLPTKTGYAHIYDDTLYVCEPNPQGLIFCSMHILHDPQGFARDHSMMPRTDTMDGLTISEMDDPGLRY